MAKANVLTTYLDSIGATKTEFNSNNAWGFGGGIGTRYELPNKYIVKIGTACFRHLTSVKYITITNPDGRRVFDEINNQRNLQMAVDIIKKSVIVTSTTKGAV